MALNDPLASILSKISKYDELGKDKCIIKPVSKVVKVVLDLLNVAGYIGKYTVIKNGNGDQFEVNLIGKINKSGVIKPRFAVKLSDYEKFEKRYLIAKDFGILIVSTPKGIMSHKEARDKKMGGKLIAYCS